MKPEKTPGSKSQLAVALSRLQVFTSPRPKLEQHPTDSEIAAGIIWTAHMAGELEDATVADLGCGTGILGIGALMLGASKVFFVDKDQKALDILSSNLKNLGLEDDAEIICSDVDDFDEKADLVIQNPPFGTKEKHADKAFLEKAMEVSDNIYSFHKTVTEGFVKKICEESGFIIIERFDFRFPLKQTMAQHRKRIERIDVSCFHLTKS